MDEDYAFALQLQHELDHQYESHSVTSDSTTMSGEAAAARHKLQSTVVDESLETIDPTPDVHALFLEFNRTYFWSKLENVEVRWSPRMTLCAGLCCYEGFGGLCSIRLSQPLLTLRPRKDLVQTLLHEMIHAYLFVTACNKDHNAHGPQFLSHMHRINELSGAKITVYHSFHDEVGTYRIHWWQCNGPCRNQSPFYGLIKRAKNRAPGPTDDWWAAHIKNCNGTFEKIKGPEASASLKRKMDASCVSALPSTKCKKVCIGGHSGEQFVPFSGKGHRIGGPSTLTIDSYFGSRTNGRGSSSETSHLPVACVEESVDVGAKLSAVVTCPVCRSSVADSAINTHLDNCLAHIT